MRAEAQSLKRQAEAELARARSEADASRAARTKAEAEAAATKLRAQAEAAAAIIRADAEATASRVRRDADAAMRTASTESAKAAQPAAKVEATRADSTSVRAAAGTAEAPAKVATAASSGVASFDGTWNVTYVCAPSEGALGFSFEFPAQVKDGFLRGDHGIEGNSGWLRLQGQIQPDGSANLNGRGVTGDTKFNTAGAAKGVTYGYSAAARFEGSHGTGHRVTGRPCDLRFAKQ